MPVDAPLRLPDDDARAAELARPSVVAIGNFDGVHRGHQAILADAREKASALGCSVCALTFERVRNPRDLCEIKPRRGPEGVT